MPRNHNAGTSTLRNRNRVTNKTRLKIFHGSIDDDSAVLEETPRLGLFADAQGVDAEDANEHHLQAVLLAASQRNQTNSHRSTRAGTAEKSNGDTVAAFIPVPDSTGVVDNYEELYPPRKRTDPATYIRSSETVEECCSTALANNFTYFMDERDQEWLEKNNEEARGEGTSAQGAVSAAGTTTRSGSTSRSAKAKGKEPDVTKPIAMSEDEFELVMGLFEKVTHEKTEYLHHSLDTGMAFPAFSEYQETFSSPLTPTVFAAFAVPAWLPSPVYMARIARVVYPYWKERRIERGGHRIIPTLNGDETDTLNESYICFRRREVKAVRKTRASQITFSDKLIRLQNELSLSLELAKSVLTRETLKKETSQHSQNVWEQRLGLVELKRKFPTLGDKADDELLHDKERIVNKRPKTEASRLPGLKIRTRDELGSPSEMLLRPKERTAMIQTQIEREVLRQKDRDRNWEDQVDNLYQPLPTAYSSRLFKYIPHSDAPSWPSPSSTDTDEKGSPLPPRGVRLRFGRGGRIMIDRRHARSPSLSICSSVRFREPQSRGRKRALPEDEEEEQWRLSQRWKYDADDSPAIGPEGTDEQDRALIDDYEPRFLRHTMTLFQDQDLAGLMTDPSILVSADGRQQPVVPFKLGQQPMIRREPQGIPRTYSPGGQLPQSVPSQTTIPMAPPLATNGTPISVPTQLKKMQPPIGLPRITSNGGMRPPGLPVVASIPTNGSVPHTSPPHNNVQPNGVNGVSRNGNTSAQVPANAEPPLNSISNGTPSQPDGVSTPNDNNAASPVRPKSQDQHRVVPLANGYHPPAVNGYTGIANGSFLHPNAPLSSQQVQTLKSAFGPDVNAMQTNATRQYPPVSFMGHVAANGTNFNLSLGTGNPKLPAARQMQWASPQRPTVNNGTDTSGIPANMSASPAHSTPGPPVRTPSSNGSRNGMRSVQSGGHVIGTGHSMSPHLQHSPSPLPSSLSQAQAQPSPPRLPQAPTMAMVSPSMQHQQPVGSSQSGY